MFVATLYRAISLPSLISKIAERVVLDRFFNVIADNYKIPCGMVLSKDALLSVSSYGTSDGQNNRPW